MMSETIFGLFRHRSCFEKKRLKEEAIKMNCNIVCIRVLSLSRNVYIRVLSLIQFTFVGVCQNSQLPFLP